MVSPVSSAQSHAVHSTEPAPAPVKHKEDSAPVDTVSLSSTAREGSAKHEGHSH